MRSSLFENYSSDCLPLGNQSLISLKMGVAFRAFNSIDQVEGTLTANMVEALRKDGNLVWDPEQYNGITDIAVNTEPVLNIVYGYQIFIFIIPLKNLWNS